MPAPSILNDWRFAVSLSYSGATPAAMRQSLLRGLKNQWIGAGTYTDDEGSADSIDDPWTVVRSSDSVSAANSDLWDADADLVWAAEGVAHSWIQLRHLNYFGTGNPLDMLLVCGPASTQNATLAVVFSRAGFSGGTITARPTAADEHIVRPTGGTVATAGWQGDDNSATSLTMRLHFLMTADGRKFHIFFTRASVCIAYWGLFDCESDIGFSEPYLFTIASEDFNAGAEVELLILSHFTSDTESTWYGRDQGGVGDFTALYITEIYGNSNTNTYVGLPRNGFNGGWLPSEMKLYGVAPAAGPLATVPDCWWARIADGTGSPGEDVDTGFDSYMQFGCMVVPWNNSTIVLG